ncbi:MAG: preprotein translocase subunit YajC [Nitrospirae bacterium]|nr:preprotein translocase subunit YajC [Nitrospirota bacterium]
MGTSPGGGAAGAGASSVSFFLPLIIIFFIFYILILLPQKKEKRKTEEMRANLKKGDKVVTAGGIHGIVAGVKETTVTVKVDDNVKMEFSRSAISQVVKPG